MIVVVGVLAALADAPAAAERSNRTPVAGVASTGSGVPEATSIAR